MGSCTNWMNEIIQALAALLIALLLVLLEKVALLREGGEKGLLVLHLFFGCCIAANRLPSPK